MAGNEGTGADPVVGFPLAGEIAVTMSTTQKIPANEQIRARREELKFSDVDMARVTRVTISSYVDLEADEKEIRVQVALYHIKRLCEVLRLSLLDLFGMPCAFCEEGLTHYDYYWLGRNEIVEQRRKALELSIEELSNLAACSIEGIKNAENYTAHLESWAVDDILELGTALQLPGQLLLDFRCPRCGR